jgi:hypothetical protein
LDKFVIAIVDETTNCIAQQQLGFAAREPAIHVEHHNTIHFS